MNITYLNTSSTTIIDPIQYNTKVSSFCEGNIYGQPEILNCLSCFFLSYIPYLGLKYSHFDNILLKNIMSLMFITGFTSFGYHWNGYYIFKLLDEIPMTLCIWLGLCHLISITHNENGLSTNISYSIMNVYFLLMMAINPIYSFFELFPFLFLFSCLSIAPFIIYYFHSFTNDFYYSQYKEAYKLVQTGMSISLVSGISWFIIEKMCNIFFIFGHALWHIGISVGMFYIITAMQYMIYLTDAHKLDTTYDFYIIYTHKYIPLIKQSQNDCL
jgi:hypothetical protein